MVPFHWEVEPAWAPHMLRSVGMFPPFSRWRSLHQATAQTEDTSGVRQGVASARRQAAFCHQGTTAMPSHVSSLKRNLSRRPACPAACIQQWARPLQQAISTGHPRTHLRPPPTTASYLYRDCHIVLSWLMYMVLI